MRRGNRSPAEIWVKDAHGSGATSTGQLPPECTLVRGWSGHPYAMVQELDDTFDAVVMVGYHGPASDPESLSHLRAGGITLHEWAAVPRILSHAHCAALKSPTCAARAEGPCAFCSDSSKLPASSCLPACWQLQLLFPMTRCRAVFLLRPWHLRVCRKTKSSH